MDTFFGLHVVILALLSLFGDGHVCVPPQLCVFHWGILVNVMN